MKKRSELFKEIIWLFVIGCLLGFVIETIWYFLKHGIIINKQGLLYGPFKPVYGAGVLLITAIFKKLENKNWFIILVLGILVGTIYEYSMSIFQEYVLGTSTWNYSKFNYNINGRIYLPYCIGWGLITLVWIKCMYPKLKTFIAKIPLWISIIVAIFMLSNLIVSALAVYEYSNRVNNIKHNSKVLNIIDEVYPDEVINKKFPKLKALKKD